MWMPFGIAAIHIEVWFVRIRLRRWLLVYRGSQEDFQALDENEKYCDSHPFSLRLARMAEAMGTND